MTVNDEAEQATEPEVEQTSEAEETLPPPKYLDYYPLPSDDQLKKLVLGDHADEYSIIIEDQPNGRFWKALYKGEYFLSDLPMAQVERPTFVEIVLACWHHHNSQITPFKPLPAPKLWPAAPRFVVEVLHPKKPWLLASLPVPTLNEANKLRVVLEQDASRREWVSAWNQPIFRVSDLAQ